MSLITVVTEVVAVITVAVLVASVAMVGPARLRIAALALPQRLREAGPPLLVLVGVLTLNSLVRETVADFSWVIGVNITGLIYAIEGDFVATVQSFATPTLTAYFATAYIYGYAFLLVFPLVSSLALDDIELLRRLAVAYSANYVIGLLCYVIFIAYGPRNLLSDSVESLLYVTYPQFHQLTSQVNTNTNVFPSLHASLSLTVVAFAARTRATSPVWFVAAVAIAASVIVSTVYLGIHWATDVVAGGVLAAVSVAAADRLLERYA